MASNVSPNVQSAVSFLRDPSVQDAPLNKKLEFLQAKGLSQTEIDAAFRLASSSGPSSSQNYNASNPAAVASGGYRPYGYAPLGQDRMRPDWRDWFIMAVVGGGVGTLAYSLARKYLFPALKPPSETELTAAQHALAAKYDEAAAILASLQEETTEIKQTVNDQCERVDQVVGQVTETLDTIKDKETERDEELKSMREEVDALKGLIERMFDKHKDAQSESLKDIEQEVKSLKSLLARRPGGDGPGISRSASPSQSNLSAAAQAYNPTTTSGGSTFPSSPSRFGLSNSSSANGMSPSSSFANILNRPPGIPAWQMQSQSQSQSTPQTANATNASSSSAASNDSSSTAQAPNNASADLSKTASTASASSAENDTAAHSTAEEDGGYVVGDSTKSSSISSPGPANGLEESGEIVPSANDVTA